MCLFKQENSESVYKYQKQCPNKIIVEYITVLEMKEILKGQLSKHYTKKVKP